MSLLALVTVAAAATPPANFSCAIGEVELAFARQLQPERTNFSGVYEALVAPHCHSDSDPGQHHDAAAAAAGAAATAAGDLQPVSCNSSCQKLQVCRLQAVALPAYYKQCEHSNVTSMAESPVVKTDDTAVTKKHIDWYCGSCAAGFINASSPGAQPELIDGILPVSFCPSMFDRSEGVLTTQCLCARHSAAAIFQSTALLVRSMSVVTTSATLLRSFAQAKQSTWTSAGQQRAASAKRTAQCWRTRKSWRRRSWRLHCCTT